MTARTLDDAYAAELAGTGIRARSVRLYLDGLSACQIAAELGRTTTPASVRTHLRGAGLGGLRWCPDCRALEDL